MKTDTQNKAYRNFCQCPQGYTSSWLSTPHTCLGHMYASTCKTVFFCIQRGWAVTVRYLVTVFFSSFLHSASFLGGNAKSTLLFRIFSLWSGTLFSTGAAVWKLLSPSDCFNNRSRGSETSNKAQHQHVPVGFSQGCSCQWSVVTGEQSAEDACSSIQPRGCPGRQAGRPAARSQQAKFNSHASKCRQQRSMDP